MNHRLLDAIAAKIQGQPGAALGLPCCKVTKEVAQIAASVVYSRITQGTNLMPDNIVKKSELDMNNPFCEWGLDSFEGETFSSFERTDFINAIKHLVSLGYFWKMAASLPEITYKEKASG